jgi:imidazolonepropionase-like amidohydrolase
MQLLVTRSGLSPLQAITTATKNGALVLGVESSYGTLAAGKVADLVILSADPTADIRNTTSIVSVMKGGKLYKREKVTLPPS